MQAFWGGQATRVCIGAVITGKCFWMLHRIISYLMPRPCANLLAWSGLAHMPNHFAASSHLETKDFIGLLIWMCAFIPAILIRPERLQVPFAVCFVLFCFTIFGLEFKYLKALAKKVGVILRKYPIFVCSFHNSLII